MIIAVISDTHDNMGAIRALLNKLREFRPSVVIHLGDIISPFALRELLSFPSKFIIVLGNNDGDKVLLKDIAVKGGAILREGIHEFSLDNLRILALHGYGSRDTTLSIVNALASSGSYDIVLYGHTHKVDVRHLGKTLVVNPGECCGYLTGRKSFALIDTSRMTVEIIDIP